MFVQSMVGIGCRYPATCMGERCLLGVCSGYSRGTQGECPSLGGGAVVGGEQLFLRDMVHCMDFKEVQVGSYGGCICVVCTLLNCTVVQEQDGAEQYEAEIRLLRK